jgi:hypothetical protein
LRREQLAGLADAFVARRRRIEELWGGKPGLMAALSR